MQTRTNESKGIICSICGAAHTTAECDYANITSHVLNTTTATRARLSLPKDFLLYTLADGKFKVVTNKSIQKGTRFGPLEAVKTFSLNPIIQFPLKIFPSNEDDFLEYYLDSANEETSTWMIFIEPAENSEEQNLICYQEGQSIYYLTLRHINENEALKVWYAPHYAKKMGKQLLEENVVEIIPAEIAVLDDLVKVQQNIPDVESWSCKFCRVVFIKITKFADHLIEKHYKIQNRNKSRGFKTAFKSPKGFSEHLSKNSQLNENNPTNKEKLERSIVQYNIGETSIGDPLLNSMAATDEDNQDTSDFIMPTLCGLNEDTQIMGVENLNTENLLMTDNFRALDYFNFEIEEEVKEDEVVCDICCKSLSSLPNLIQHLKGHRGDYYCVSCNKVFGRKENLTYHSCNVNFTFKCSSCDRTFSQKKYYKRHLDTVHNRKFECENCRKNYANRYELQQHNCKKINDDQRNNEKHDCRICHKTFSQQRYLKKHVTRRHGDTRIFICEICSKEYSTKVAYEAHALSHKERQYKCEICHKEFHRKDIFKEHVENVHNNQELKCDICAKTFKSKKYLLHHKKIHEKIKYICKMCPSTFDTKSNLTRHIKIHQRNENDSDGKLLHQCKHCGKKMKLRSSLARHIQNKHSNLVDAVSQDATADEEVEEKGVLQFLRDGLDLIGDSQDNIDLINEEDIDELGRRHIQVIDNILLTKSEEMGLGINYILNSNETKTQPLVKTKEAREYRGDKTEDREVLLSMPDLMEIENDIILGEDEFMTDSAIMASLE